MSYESFFEEQERIEAKLDAILAYTAKLLIKNQQNAALSIILNTKSSITGIITDEGHVIRWLINFDMPMDVFLALDGRGAIENAIDDALSVIVEAMPGTLPILCQIRGELEDDPEWRSKIRQIISGEGVTNQGRVRSSNIATRQYDGLLFRSKPEIYFYSSLKNTGIPFAPLPVCLKGGYRIQKDRTRFPDFQEWYHYDC